jgi:2-keto-3-deoxy-L-rhamnonate aldolase RhmA
MTKMTNPVKAALAAGEVVFGATITVNSVEIAAQAANFGFDFLWIEMEHSPITLDGLRGMVLATRGLKAVPIARVPVNEIWQAKRVLDAGALGVIFPFTSTPELARQAVTACRYPPLGKRGSGAGLASFRWPTPPEQPYYDFADENVLVITVVEDVAGLENIDEIAATPGLDVIFIGTSDLSFSMGLRGAQGHPEHQKAIERIVDATRRNGKYAGRPVGNPRDVAASREQGFRLFQVPTDIGFMAAGAREYLNAIGRGPAASVAAADKGASKPLY